MTSKNGVSFHLPKQLQRAAAGAEQQGAASRRDTLSRRKKAGASRPGFQRYSQRANQWDSQNCSTRQAPPRQAPVHPSSRFGVRRSGTESSKLGQNSQDFHSITVCSWHLTGHDGAVVPYRTVPVCYCVHTICKHKQEHRYRDVPAQNTSAHRTRLKFRAHTKAGN